jgi:hypothetical protein
MIIQSSGQDFCRFNLYPSRRGKQRRRNSPAIEVPLYHQTLDPLTEIEMNSQISTKKGRFQ